MVLNRILRFACSQYRAFGIAVNTNFYHGFHAETDRQIFAGPMQNHAIECFIKNLTSHAAYGRIRWRVTALPILPL